MYEADDAVGVEISHCLSMAQETASRPVSECRDQQISVPCYGDTMREAVCNDAVVFTML